MSDRHTQIYKSEVPLLVIFMYLKPVKPVKLGVGQIVLTDVEQKFIFVDSLHGAICSAFDSYDHSQGWGGLSWGTLCVGT